MSKTDSPLSNMMEAGQNGAPLHINKPCAYHNSDLPLLPCRPREPCIVTPCLRIHPAPLPPGVPGVHK